MSMQMKAMIVAGWMALLAVIPNLNAESEPARSEHGSSEHEASSNAPVSSPEEKAPAEAPAEAHSAKTVPPGKLQNKAPESEKLSSQVRESANIKEEKNVAGTNELREFTVKLDLARLQRRNKDFVQSEQDFLSVVNSSAPEDLRKVAMSELAGLCEEIKQFLKAQKIYSEMIRLFPNDPGVPELMLRQGLLYREMGANNRALTKFYAVMSTALNSKNDDRLDYYKRLVLRAQTEVAETFYLDGKYAEAADKLKLLLKQENPDLNRGMILYKLIRCLYSMEAYADVAGRGETYVDEFPDSPEQPEVRFLLASSLKKLGRTSDSLQQVALLLQNQKKIANSSPETWRYWQQRTGNEIANQLYQEGDFLNALQIYTKLSELDPSPGWQLPVLYQIGLVYEQLKQPDKAIETYRRILGRQKEITGEKLTSLQTILDMAKWRQNRLDWQAKAERVEKDLGAAAPEKAPQTTEPAEKQQ